MGKVSYLVSSLPQETPFPAPFPLTGGSRKNPLAGIFREPPVRLELTTCRLQNGCSTN